MRTRILSLVTLLAIAPLAAEAQDSTSTSPSTSTARVEATLSAAADAGIPATFERSDVYPWLEQAAAEGRTFDVVFCSYGALCWLSDIDEWLRRVAAVLKPGGRFVCVEFHPVAMIFDEQAVPTYDYSMAEPLFWDDGIRDYVADACGGLTPSGPVIAAEPFRNPHPAFEFQRGLSEILGAPDLTWPRSHGYSDSSADLPMLRCCMENTLVNPSPKLTAIGDVRGWEIERPVKPWSGTAGHVREVLRRITGL